MIRGFSSPMLPRFVLFQLFVVLAGVSTLVPGIVSAQQRPVAPDTAPNPALIPPVPLSGTIVDPSEGTNNKAQQVIRDVMSPFCPGLSLEACPSPDAQILRTEIRRDMANGQTEEQIRASLVSRFGRAVLGIPPDDLFGAVAWAMPWVALLVGGVGVTFWLRRRTARPVSSVTPATASPAAGVVTASARSVPSESDAEILDRIRAAVARDET